MKHVNQIIKHSPIEFDIDSINKDTKYILTHITNSTNNILHVVKRFKQYIYYTNIRN